MKSTPIPLTRREVGGIHLLFGRPRARSHYGALHALTNSARGGNPWPNLICGPHTQGAAERCIPQLVGRPSTGTTKGQQTKCMNSPIGGNPWLNLGCSPRTTPPRWEDPWKYFAHKGGPGGNLEPNSPVTHPGRRV